MDFFSCFLRYACIAMNLPLQFSSVQFSSVAQSCPTLCNPMNHSTPGFPVHHQLLEFTQTHVHRVSDAIQLSHPLSSPSPHQLEEETEGLWDEAGREVNIVHSPIRLSHTHTHPLSTCASGTAACCRECGIPRSDGGGGDCL